MRIRAARILRRFLSSRDGNVAMMFGLLLIPLIIAGGIAVDIGRAGHARATLQEAADEALLRAARLKTLNPKATDAELTDIARKIVEATIAKLSGVTIDAFAVKYDPVTEEFRLVLSGELPTTLMAAVGKKSMPIDTISAVKLGKPPYLEVVMALDNTGSMNQKSKISQLKTSSKALVDALFAMEGAGVKVGLVPFAQYVNVGADKKSSSWLSVPKSAGAWKGCVGSRNYPSNLEDSDYVTKPVPGLVGAPCPDPILALSDDKAKIKAALDGMDANGWTYIPSGLVWGWRALSPVEPYTEGLSYAELKDRAGVKSLIVLTDGENTRAPDYPTHNSANQSQANDLMMKLCKNIKADGIVIYAIAFDVSDATIRTLLEECATSPGYYFAAENAVELTKAFQDIATSLRSISLSK